MPDDLTITIGGDISALDTAFEQITTEAQNTANGVAAAFGSVDPFQGLSAGAQDAVSAINNVGTAAVDTQESWNGLLASAEGAGQAVDNAGTAASQTAPQVENLGTGLHSTKEHADEANASLAEMGQKLIELAEALAVVEVMKEFASEALEMYGNVQKATISLTALTGSAGLATQMVEGLKEVAMSDALNFESVVGAAQKMTALGFSADQMRQSIQSAADTAAATGNSFDTVAAALDRMALSGMANGRMLATLGISLKDLADAMNTTSDQVAVAFRALDQSERIDALNTALNKFSGVAQQVAQGVLGQWQDFKTQWGFVMESVGGALAPVATDLMNLGKTDIIPFLQGVVDGFAKLPGPIKDATVAATAAATAFGAMWLAFGGPAALVTAAAGINALVAIASVKSITSDLHTVISEVSGDWKDMDTAVTDATAKLQSHNAAATAAFKAYVDAHTPLNQVAADFNDLNKKVADAKTYLDQVKTAYDNGTASLGQLQAAQDTYNKAVDALNGTAPTLQQNIDKLAASYANGAMTLDTLSTKILAASNNAHELQTKFADLIAQDVAGSLDTIATGAAAVVESFGAVVTNVIATTQALNDTDVIMQAVDQDLHNMTQHTDDYVLANQHVPDVTDAFRALKVQTDAERQSIVDNVTWAENFATAMRSLGEISQEEWQRMHDAAVKALDGMQKSTNDLNDQINNLPHSLDGVMIKLPSQVAVWSARLDDMNKAVQQVNQAIERDLSKAITDAIFQTGSLSKAFTKLGEDVVSIILDHIIKEAMTPLLDALDKVVGKILSTASDGLSGAFGSLAKAGTDCFGAIGKAVSDTTEAIGTLDKTVAGAAADLGGGASSAASGAAGAAGGVTQAVGGILSTVSSIVGMITGAISAVTGIISVFQNMHQTDILRSIESNTRKTTIYIGEQGQNVMWCTQKTVEYLGYAVTDLDHIGVQMDALVGMQGTGSVQLATEDTLLNVFEYIKYAVTDLDHIGVDLDGILGKLQDGIQATTQSAGGSVTDTNIAAIANASAVLVADMTLVLEGLRNINNGTYYSAIYLGQILQLMQKAAGQTAAAVQTAVTYQPVPTELAAAAGLPSDQNFVYGPGGYIVQAPTPQVAVSNTAASAASLRSQNPGVSISVTNNGNIVGQGGMQQLADTISNAFTDRLRSSGLKF